MKTLCKYLILMLLLVSFSCDEKNPKPSQPITKGEMKSSMEKANRYLLNEEAEDIENYVKRHGLNMTTTGTGLRYQILKQGSEQKIEKGELSILRFVKKSGYSMISNPPKLKYRLKNSLKSHLPDRIRIFCYNNSFLSKIVFR